MAGARAGKQRRLTLGVTGTASTRTDPTGLSASSRWVFFLQVPAIALHAPVGTLVPQSNLPGKRRQAQHLSAKRMAFVAVR